MGVDKEKKIVLNETKMNKDNEIKHFKKLLKLRTIFKQVNQISWNITALEKRYPLNTLSNTEIQGLLSSYVGYAKEIKELNDELKKELDEKKKR